MERGVRLAINVDVRAPVAVEVGRHIGSFDLPANLAAGKIRGVNIDIPSVGAQIGDLLGRRAERQRTDGAVPAAGKRKIETNILRFLSI